MRIVLGGAPPGWVQCNQRRAVCSVRPGEVLRRHVGRARHCAALPRLPNGALGWRRPRGDGVHSDAGADTGADTRADAAPDAEALAIADPGTLARADAEPLARANPRADAVLRH